MRTMGQKRAAYALEKVTSISRNTGEFKTFSAGAPTMILKNGFGQALAFWLAKGKPHHIDMFDIVVGWLSYNNNDDVNNTFATHTDPELFLREIAGMRQKKYLRCQEETLKLLEWVKRFANADLGGQG